MATSPFALIGAGSTIVGVATPSSVATGVVTAKAVKSALIFKVLAGTGAALGVGALVVVTGGLALGALGAEVEEVDSFFDSATNLGGNLAFEAISEFAI